MKSLSKFKTLLLLGVFAFSITAFTSMDDWPVPAEYKKKTNPYAKKGDDGTGERLYKIHCKNCHGSKGLADGPKSRMIKVPMRKFNEKAVQAQTDGALYYKSIIGRPAKKMPNYEKKIRAEKDRWMLVNYIRTLK